MSSASLALCLILWGSPLPASGELVPAGLHPTATLLAACAVHDPRPQRLDRGDESQLPVWVHIALPVSAATLPSTVILLRSAGLHRIAYRDAEGHEFFFITTDPERRPPVEPVYGIRTLVVRHGDPEQIAQLLAAFADLREPGPPDGQVRTTFVADARTRRIVVRHRLEVNLQPYLDLALELDRPPVDGARGEVLRLVRVRNTRAADLAVALENERVARAWPPIEVVVQQQTNSLLLRVPAPWWSDLQALIETLDRLPPRTPPERDS